MNASKQTTGPIVVKAYVDEEKRQLVFDFEGATLDTSALSMYGSSHIRIDNGNFIRKSPSQANMEIDNTVKSHKKLFARWKALGCVELGGIVQNDMTVADAELDRWVRDVHRVAQNIQKDFEDLLVETLVYLTGDSIKAAVLSEALKKFGSEEEGAKMNDSKQTTGPKETTSCGV